MSQSKRMKGFDVRNQIHGPQFFSVASSMWFYLLAGMLPDRAGWLSDAFNWLVLGWATESLARRTGWLSDAPIFRPCSFSIASSHWSCWFLSAPACWVLVGPTDTPSALAGWLSDASFCNVYRGFDLPNFSIFLCNNQHWSCSTRSAFGPVTLYWSQNCLARSRYSQALVGRDVANAHRAHNTKNSIFVLRRSLMFSRPRWRKQVLSHAMYFAPTNFFFVDTYL
jgi:hypothetical protein